MHPFLHLLHLPFRSGTSGEGGAFAEARKKFQEVGDKEDKKVREESFFNELIITNVVL